MVIMCFVCRIPSTIFGMPWHELRALGKIGDKKDDESSTICDFGKSIKRKKHRRNLLGKLSTDLDYLETLLTEVKVGESTPKEPTDKFVKKQAEEAISFLRDRQEFWSQFKPIYSK